jgi:MoCo/4Fe-4S cofactor protein with predicted Tat translocation signal
MATTNGPLNSAIRVPSSEMDQFTSIDQWMGSPAFADMIQDEFPEDAAEWLDPVTRRRALTLMGASVALAGAVGCNPSLKPASDKKAVPYVKKPDGLTAGNPLFFPTAYSLGGVGLGLLVKSVEGRPIKVEGNPSHPTGRGGTDLFAQGTVLQMYDPDRSKKVTERGVATTFERAKAALLGRINDHKTKKDDGAGFCVLSETVSSPTLVALMADLKTALPKMRWVQYEPVSRDTALQGAKLAFGKYVVPQYNLAAADVVLFVDSDFGPGPDGVKLSRDAMSRRKLRVSQVTTKGDGVSLNKLSRIYAVESAPTGTGGVADHRLPLKPSEVESFVRALAKEVGVDGPAAGPLPELATQWVKPLAADLLKRKQKAAVVAGDTLSAVGHALVHAINAKLEAGGKTVTYTAPPFAGFEKDGPDADAAADQTGSLKKLAADMAAGQVTELVVLGGNPVYTAPADLNFLDALRKVPFKFHHGLYQDETAVHCDWHVNAAHELESWGDVRAIDGTVTVLQPLIAPFFGGKTAIELVAAVLDKPQGLAQDPRLLVQGTWTAAAAKKDKAADLDAAWHAAVEQGVVPGTTFDPVEANLTMAPAVKAAPAPATKAGELELAFRPDPTLYDGRFANVSWFQELPKPITKLTWDNAAILSPATADKLKVTFEFGYTGGEHGRMFVNKIDLKVGGRSLKIAAFVLPGHPDDTITLHLGHGRTRAGKVGTNPENGGGGFDTYTLRTTTTLWAAAGAEAVNTREQYTLACTQGQHAMEGRRPARHGTVDDIKGDAKNKPTTVKVPHGDHSHDVDVYPSAFEFADNPPAASAEKGLMRELLPGAPEERERLAAMKWLPFAEGVMTEQQEHALHLYHEAHPHDHTHDARLTPLTIVADVKVHKQYRRWAMAIDLGACTGCSACVAACVAENNIPVLGKDQVTKGRAMHWIRVDRYFAASNEAGGTKRQGYDDRWEALKQSTATVTTHFQPVPCQQCEKAPCELVCPVGATIHSNDGLNDMAYNRCVGTRYCSNNCPYKVRRFNFLQYADYSSDSTLKLVNNPEVTVRTRGVMEKCTYCVQRIRNAEIEAEREHLSAARPKATMPDGTVRPVILEGEVVTACQQACPSKAISFGDLNYDQYQVNGKRLGMSEVARWKFEPTHYGLLAELNTMPRTTYLAAVKNPNPDMPKGA